jgi:hypothetical protein
MAITEPPRRLASAPPVLNPQSPASGSGRSRARRVMNVVWDDWRRGSGGGSGTVGAGDGARDAARVGGVHIPGVISAGRFYSHGQLVLWDVHDPEKAIGITLRDERYGRLVLEVEDPEAEIARVEQATAGVPA